MSKNKEFDATSQFIGLRNFFMMRGLIMIIYGGLFATLSIVSPAVRILSETNSWLPMAAFMIMLSGFLMIFDAIISRHKDSFLMYAQLAACDIVVGIMILAELDNDALNLSLLLAFYLISRSFLRIFAGMKIHFPHSRSVIISGFIGFLLGVIIWLQWPYYSLGFLSFVVCLDIALRGWSLLVFGMWLRELHNSKLTTS